MRIEPFAMERMQSVHEHQVEINLAESGVLPLTLDELLEDDAARRAVFDRRLGYPQTNGTVELRAAIADLYPGVDAGHVLVTNGGAEANFVSVWHLLEPGDEVVCMAPNYMQIPGLARAFGAEVRLWRLRESGSGDTVWWRRDVDELRDIVTGRTRLIAICTPNNPTGARLDATDLDAICRIAERHGAWVLSDEIYCGAERDGLESASIWGRYERAIVTSGLSKAYGLPGLRIGWVVAPPPLAAALWAHHDYTTIAPGLVNDHLARLTLRPPTRQRILERTRRIVREQYPIVQAWLATQGRWFSHVPPEAGAIAYVRYTFPMNSTSLADRLRDRRSVLIVPGDHFGMDGYLRVGFGYDAAALRLGLERFGEMIGECVSAGPS